MTPAKKFASLERVCLDALVQLFGSRPFSSALPKSCFKHQLFPSQPVLPNEVSLFLTRYEIQQRNVFSHRELIIDPKIFSIGNAIHLCYN